MKAFVASIILISFTQCNDNGNYRCTEAFFECASVCSSICDKTISKGYEYGKCFTICTAPCRKEYCKKKEETE